MQGVSAVSGKGCSVAPQHTTNHTPNTPTLSPSTLSKSSAEPKAKAGKRSAQASEASKGHRPQANRPRRSKALQASVARMEGSLTSKPWRTLWQHEKLARAFEAAGNVNGQTFTLNLDPTREQTFLNRADPADDLRRRISRELKSALGYLPAYGFTFEVSPSGRLHVHGVIVPNFSGESDMRKIRDALARSAGKMTGKHAARQVAFTQITDGMGWAAYCQKALDTACRYLGTNKVSYISTDLLRFAKG